MYHLVLIVYFYIFFCRFPAQLLYFTSFFLQAYFLVVVPCWLCLLLFTIWSLLFRLEQTSSII